VPFEPIVTADGRQVEPLGLPFADAFPGTSDNGVLTTYPDVAGPGSTIRFTVLTPDAFETFVFEVPAEPFPAVDF
jgi:hypothetical protein